MILWGLKRRLEEAKGAWAEQLHHILWAYKTTPQSTTGELPFRITYRSEAMIPVEVRESSLRLQQFNEQNNSEAMNVSLDLVEFEREIATIKEAAAKQRIERRYNQHVRKRNFQTGDLVLQRSDIGTKPQGEKIAQNWEGPYRVIANL